MEVCIFPNVKQEQIAYIKWGNKSMNVSAVAKARGGAYH